MPLPIQETLNRYAFARDQLRERAPNAWNEVIQLCNALPERIDVQAFWFYGKDKPCWSNIRVQLGQRIASDLAHVQDFDSCVTIASDVWNITMLNVGPRWKANANFEIRGDSARHYLENLQPGGLASYKWRLYAIREFALSLLREDGGLPMVQALVEKVNRLDGLSADEVNSWTQRFAKVAGRGWGTTTVNHMLTDLGLSVKPDLHLRRSAVRLGLLEPEIRRDLPVAEIDNRAVELGPMAVRAIFHMAQGIQPTAAPERPGSILREIDKVLMEWSRQQNPIGSWCAEKPCR
jgi:hypothetical protein